MERRRFIKRLMGLGVSRNDARRLADSCDGDMSHRDVLALVLTAWSDAICGEWPRALLPGETDAMLRSAIATAAIDAAFGRVTGQRSGSLGGCYYG